MQPEGQRSRETNGASQGLNAAAALRQRHKKQQDGAEGSVTGMAGSATKWQKALNPSTQWDKARSFLLRCAPPSRVTNRSEPKTELHEVVYWLRQVLALVCGVTWGLLPLTGYVGNLSYLALSGLALFIFFAKYHRTVDPEWYWPLTQEGYLPAYALFLVVWIITYNTAHVG